MFNALLAKENVKPRYFWVTSYILSGLVFVSFFVPATTAFFSVAGEPILLFALAVAALGLLVGWIQAIRTATTRQIVLSVILTIAFSIYAVLVISLGLAIKSI